MRLVKPDSTFGTQNKASGSDWPTSETSAFYGGVSDLWGEQWTASDINDADFGVALASAGTSGSNRQANVDYVAITVTYIKQFYIFNVTNAASPVRIGELSVSTTTVPAPVPVAAGYTAIAVATSTVTGHYAFAATNSTTGQLQVIDVNVIPGNNSPKVVTTYAISGAPGASTLFYKDGYVYLGLPNNPSGPELFILDVHNPLSIPALTLPNFTFELGAGINAIYVKNNKVYLATDDNTRELVILNVSDLAHPTLYAAYQAPGATGFGYGRSLYTVGDTAYLGRTYVANAPELEIIDAQTPTLVPLTPTGSGGPNDIGPNAGNPYGIYGVIARDTRALVLTSAASGGQLRVMNISNPASITQTASHSLPNAGGGVALDCEANYVYAASVPQGGSFLNRGSLTFITAP